jgi:FKBP-type peptidyl-prolyl cis-trans isomerase
MYESPGNGDALLLTTGQRIHSTARPFSQTNLPEHRSASLARLRTTHSVELEYQTHVLFDIERGNEVEELVDKTDVLAAEQRKARLRKSCHLHAVDFNRPAVGAIDAADQVQKRGFSGAAASDNGDNFAVGKLSLRVVQHTMLALTLAKAARQAFNADHAEKTEASGALISETVARCGVRHALFAWPASPRCLMNAAVGPRKVSAQERSFHNTAIAIALLSCASIAWSQSPPDKATSSTAAPAAAQPKKPASAATGGASDVKAPTNAKAQASYSIGVYMGDQLHHMGVTGDAIATERLTQGLRDALAGKVAMTEADQQNMANFLKTARTNMADHNRAAAKAFLTENGKKKDVVTTASGLQYHVVSPGDGASPKSTDEVTVNYRGTLLDGTEFDSSYKRGQPASFPVNGVIPGWQEALVLMKPGAKWELFIPPNLAYDVNSPPAIPPGSLLKFDVELIKVKQPAPAVPGAKVPSSQ